MKVQLFATCNGDGYWSMQNRRTVEITDLYIGDITVLSLNAIFGELRAYFTPESWSLNYGLIYTDEGWMDDFRKELRRIGFSEDGVNDIGYSEQGMQGDNYVSMDFHDSFYADWVRLNGPYEKENQ